MAPTLFARPWSDLTPEDVRGFLASASGEGFVWEGKGTDPLSKLKWKIRHGVCALANQLGGYFIVGAEETQKGWDLAGVLGDVKEDPHDWICRVVARGLANPPPFDVRCWDLGGDRVAAVVQVDQVAEPPCMTIDGLVYVRVVGESQRVRDPAVLRQLIRAGELARRRAEGKARALVGRLAIAEPGLSRLAIALSPTAISEDVAGRIFSPALREAILAAANALPKSPHAGAVPAYVESRRDGFVAFRGDFSDLDAFRWMIRAGWEGTVGVEYAIPQESVPRIDVVKIVELAWQAAASLLPLVSGIADAAHVPTHLAIKLVGERFEIEGRQVRTPDLPIQRWVTMEPPDEETVASIERELKRIAGFEALEPSAPARAEE